MENRFRVATFNANSLRSRLEITTGWLRKHEPDALCIQETRVMDDAFPVAAFEEIGYHPVFLGQKSFNGVAILCRTEPEDVTTGLGVEGLDNEARIIRAKVRGVEVVNTYVPQGTAVESPRFEYKLNWISALKDYFDRNFTPSTPLVWVGDFNVAPEPIDVHDPEKLLGSVCFHPKEHEVLSQVKQWGFVDVFRKHHPGEPDQYSFYDYRIPNALKRKLGWRIDHIWATAPLADTSSDCWIDLEPRSMEKPSDHTFVVADFQLDVTARS
ncbi:MAG: exodeoxyribonuclease III [Armatimonadota bacterium]|jgi:exodeoxyribonuclease-3